MLRQGDTSKAVFNLSKAIALQTNDPEMYFMRAEVYEKVSNYVHVKPIRILFQIYPTCNSCDMLKECRLTIHQNHVKHNV